MHNMNLTILFTLLPVDVVFSRSWMKGATVLVVLLGLTWAFGLLYVCEHTLPMAYLFTIMNSLQGTLIFVFHCLLNEKVQNISAKVAL